MQFSIENIPFCDNQTLFLPKKSTHKKKPTIHIIVKLIRIMIDKFTILYI